MPPTWKWKCKLALDAALHSQTDPTEPSPTSTRSSRNSSPSASAMKVFGIAIASAALAAVLAADPNALPANIAPPENAATPPATPAPDADAVEPVTAMQLQTQAPNGKAEPQTQFLNANAPPSQAQTPNGQAQPANNDSRVPDIAQSSTPMPDINGIKLVPVRLANGNTIAVLSDLGSQSVVLATALAAEPNALQAKTAAPQTTVTPPTSPASGVNSVEPVTTMPPQVQAPTTKAPPQTQPPNTGAPMQTQVPTGQAQSVGTDFRMPSDTLAQHSNDVHSAPVNPVGGDTITPPPGADAAPQATPVRPQIQPPTTGAPPQMQAPAINAPPQTQPVNAGAPPQTQAPNNTQAEVPDAGAPPQTPAPNVQAQLANNNTQAPGNNTLTPRTNDTEPAHVKPVNGKTLAVSSDSGSQSADIGDEVERKSYSDDSESHSGSGSKSSKSPKSPKPKIKKSDAASTATAGLISAAVVTVAVIVAFM